MKHRGSPDVQGAGASRRRLSAIDVAMAALAATTLGTTLVTAGVVAAVAVATVGPAIPALAALPEEKGWVYLPNGVREDGMYVDDLLRQVMAEKGIPHPSHAGEFPHGLRVELIRGANLEETVNRVFYQRGWTDGLPIVAPTEARVQQMLRGTRRAAADVVAILEPMKGVATVEKVAVNAVMAGCRPEHLPVLLAAVEAMADPEFNLLGVQTTTNPDTPLVIVNGPMASASGIHCGTNCLGPGWQANATIGRAVRLVLNNIGGGWPGVADMSNLGWPGKFTACAAENEAASPWEPLHVELGFRPHDSTVTVMAAEGMQNVISISRNSEQFLQTVADHMAGLDRAKRREMLVILTPDTAGMLARDGYDKQAIRRYLAAHAVMPWQRYRDKFVVTRSMSLEELERRVPALAGAAHGVEPAPETPVPVPLLERLHIVVMGGPGEKCVIVPIWSTSRAITRKIDAGGSG